MVVKGCAMNGTTPHEAVTLRLDLFNQLEEEDAILLSKEHVYDLARVHSFLRREGEGGWLKSSSAYVTIPGYWIIALD